MKQRTIAAPVVESDFAATKNKLVFWKQILPQSQVHYTAKSGARKVINFSTEYLQDLVDSFNGKVMDQVPFVLADESNRHTMDPERFRGNMVDVRLAKDGEEPGLYGKIAFESEEDAAAVLKNPGLPVSARIREMVPTTSGNVVKRALIHVLGTMDPQITGMSPWQPAEADLSNYTTNVLDLSAESYEKEQEMPKQTKAPAKALEDITNEDIDAMSEAELDAFLAENAPGLLDSLDGSDDEDDDLVDEHVDENDEELEPALSHQQGFDIELANQRIAAADARALDAQKRMAAAEWRAEREQYAAAGVPDFLLELATPVLSRPDEMVVDLSVTDDENINVSDVVRGFLDAAKGTVDLSNEQGHSVYNANDDADPDKAVLDGWKI